MGKKLKKIVLKWAMVLAGILVITSAVDFGIWVKGPEIVEQMMQQISYVDEQGEADTKVYLYKALGLDRFFIPAFWPFQDRYTEK